MALSRFSTTCACRPVRVSFACGSASCATCDRLLGPSRADRRQAGVVLQLIGDAIRAVAPLETEARNDIERALLNAADRTVRVTLGLTSPERNPS